MTLNASVKPEEVAEDFVRINGEGKKLNQSDFIVTLMSVFWDKGRAELEDFAQTAAVAGQGAPSGFNHYFKPSPDQLLRATVHSYAAFQTGRRIWQSYGKFVQRL